MHPQSALWLPVTYRIMTPSLLVSFLVLFYHFGHKDLLSTYQLVCSINTLEFIHFVSSLELKSFGNTYKVNLYMIQLNLVVIQRTLSRVCFPFMEGLMSNSFCMSGYQFISIFTYITILMYLIQVSSLSIIKYIKILSKTRPAQKYRGIPQGKKSKSQIMGIKCHGKTHILEENEAQFHRLQHWVRGIEGQDLANIRS